MFKDPYEVKRQDIPLMEYFNIFFANSIWMKKGFEKCIATFDLTLRDMPKNWSFLLFNGSGRLQSFLLSHLFDKNAVRLLKKFHAAETKELENFYKNFHFSGDVYCLRDGTPFFPSEPIVRITAPLLEANVITALMLNILNYPILSLSKGARLLFASQNKAIFSSMVRLPGFEQGAIINQVVSIFDGLSTNAFFFKTFPDRIPKKALPAVNMNHAVIKSFPSERDAFQFALDEVTPYAQILSIMTDTYDYKKGLQILIEEMKKRPQLNTEKILIQIDSGDLFSLAKYTRKLLDRSGYKTTKILVGSNLDEYGIARIQKQNAPIDFYVSATEFANITDNPKLEVVYKMAELCHPSGTIELKAKLVKGKESYPGRKQIFRLYKNGKMQKDIIGFENEKLGEPLLVPIIKNGKPCARLDDMENTRVYVKGQLNILPDYLHEMKAVKYYPVSISKKLEISIQKLRKEHLKVL